MKLLPSTLLIGAAVVCTAATAAAQSPVLLKHINGPTYGKFGYSVSDAGDLDQDGFNDILIGATAISNNRGQAYAYSGLTGGLLWTAAGEQADDSFGWEVSRFGDVNGDGFPEVAVCAFGQSPPANTRGKVYVLSGLDGSTLWSVSGDAPFWRYGTRMDAAGDYNNDGTPDLIVASDAATINGDYTGIVRVYSGSNGAVLLEVYGYKDWSNFGSDVSAAGDVNFDGYDDIIVGSESNDWFGEGRGTAYVFSGADNSILELFVGTDDYDFHGASVDGQADCNGDGIADYLVGSKYTSVFADDGGSIHVYSGADGSELWRVDGQYFHNVIGRNAKFAGDQNGDGYDDVLVGNYRGGYDGNINDPGRGYVYCYSGVDGSLLWLLDPGVTGDMFGFDISMVGDTNGDGADDFIVGAPAYGTSGTGDGYVNVYGAPFSSQDLYMLTPQPLVSGTKAIHWVNNAKYNSHVTLYAGVGREPTFLSHGIRLDIMNPVPIAGGVANANDTARIATWIRPGLAGYKVWLQAASGLGKRSNVNFRVIQ